jgi:acetoin utilization deacetylase AcuC-like enzyme
LVIAAREALTAGAQSVLILDLDAHCGGGTRSMIQGDPRIWQVDVAVNSYDSYESSDHAWLEIARNGADYLPTVDRRLNALDRRGLRFDLCLYNAGMDPHENCPTGGMSGITRDVLSRRERMVFDWCLGRRLPIAFVLAGGYVGPRLDEAGLIDLHRLTVSSAAEASRVRRCV